MRLVLAFLIVLTTLSTCTRPLDDRTIQNVRGLQTVAETMCAEVPGHLKPCIPVVACLDGAPLPLVGFALARDQGALLAVAPGGMQCSGQWLEFPGQGKGGALFSCSNNQSGGAVFTYLDPKTGSAYAQSTTDQGAALRFWAGRSLPQTVAQAPISSQCLGARS